MNTPKPMILPQVTASTNERLMLGSGALSVNKTAEVAEALRYWHTRIEKKRSVTTWRKHILPFTDSIAAHLNGRKVSEHGEALRYFHKEQREATFATTWREIKQKVK